MYNYGFDWWFFPFAPLFWTVIWIFFIVFIFRGFGRHRRWDRYHHESQKEMTAEEVLADRFAHGEIDEKEYEERLEVLKKHNKKS